MNRFLPGIFYHKRGGTNRKEKLVAGGPPALGLTDQSHPNSFTNLKKYCGKARLLSLGEKPPPQSAAVSCGVTATELFTFPKRLPRLPHPQGS